MNKKTLMSLALGFVLSASSLAHEGHKHDDKHEAKLAEQEKASALGKDFYTGEGRFLYTSNMHWAQTPSKKMEIGSAHGGVLVDKEGNVYTSTDNPKAIQVYDKDGKWLRNIGNRKFHNLYLRIEDKEEIMYAVSNNGFVNKYKLDGTLIFEKHIKRPSYYEEKSKFRPTGITVGLDGRIYIADGYGSNYVTVYSPDMKELFHFGGGGKEHGKLNQVHDIILDDRAGKDKAFLLLADRVNRRIEAYDFEGKYIKTLATDLRRPGAFAFWGDYTAVAELDARVVIFDKDWKMLARLGDNPNRKSWAKHGYSIDKWQPHYFSAPHGLCFDKHGNLFVQDWNRWGRFTKLTLVK